jgi:LPS sulfotransferase NodH
MDNDNKTGGKGLSTDEFIHQLMTKLKTRPDSTPPYRSLLIFSTPRSGSTYYSDVLSSAGQIGECREWFNFRYMKAYCNIFQLQDLNFDKYLEFIRAKTSNNTGTFAVNMHIDQYRQLKQQGIDVLGLSFDLVIYLERAEKIAQAVSLAKASLSDQWSDFLRPARELPESIPHSLITGSLAKIQESQEFFENNLRPHCDFHFIYEDFTSQDNLKYFERPLEKLGLNMPLENLHTQLSKQADQHSEKLIEEYKQALFNSYQESRP